MDLLQESKTKLDGSYLHGKLNVIYREEKLIACFTVTLFQPFIFSEAWRLKLGINEYRSRNLTVEVVRLGLSSFF